LLSDETKHNIAEFIVSTCIGIFALIVSIMLGMVIFISVENMGAWSIAVPFCIMICYGAGRVVRKMIGIDDD
jgi:hypothetical protein